MNVDTNSGVVSKSIELTIAIAIAKDWLTWFIQDYTIF
jgi:hypothetical protein